MKAPATVAVPLMENTALLEELSMLPEEAVPSVSV
jgi:hypothetical protein